MNGNASAIGSQVSPWSRVNGSTVLIQTFGGITTSLGLEIGF